MTLDEVNEIAQGWVWSGEQALKIKLVDELGGLEQTIKKAAQLAGISEYRTVAYPQLTDPLIKMIGNIFGDEFTAKMQTLNTGPRALRANQLPEELKTTR